MESCDAPIVHLTMLPMAIREARRLIMQDIETIDISPYPELQQLIEAARRGHEPRMLRVGDEDVAILMPIGRRGTRHGRKPSKEDLDAFLATAGSWKDLVDTDQLKADIAESRRRSIRPRVDR